MQETIGQAIREKRLLLVQRQTITRATRSSAWWNRMPSI
jgi:hypothetical protein